jgi:hypothetical protein
MSIRGSTHGLETGLVKLGVLLPSDIWRSWLKSGKAFSKLGKYFRDTSSPPRKPWKSEDARMDIFEAVALGLM